MEQPVRRIHVIKSNNFFMSSPFMTFYYQFSLLSEFSYIFIRGYCERIDGSGVLVPGNCSAADVFFVAVAEVVNKLGEEVLVPVRSERERVAPKFVRYADLRYRIGNSCFPIPSNRRCSYQE